jgi:spermidine synthase
MRGCGFGTKGSGMDFIMKELAYSETPMGTLSLRCRTDAVTQRVVHEIKLNDEFLMSDLFTEAEEELARLGLSMLDGDSLSVVVGGLGLGYTARSALADARVGELIVVDALPEVIQWHREHLLPLGKELSADPRCRLVQDDFFAMAGTDGFDPDQPGRTFDAILLDVDHSPRWTLHPSHAWLYERAGLSRLAGHINPGGVFALWSNDPPDDAFCGDLAAVFTETQAHVVTFPNPLQNRDATNTVYTARKP